MVHAVPGRANVIAGQTGIFRTHGSTAEQMTIRFPAGMLVNLGEVPKQSYPNKLPTTRHGHGQPGAHGACPGPDSRAQSKPAKARTSSPRHNLKLEALDLALEGKIPVIFAAHRADESETGTAAGPGVQAERRGSTWRPRAT